MEMVDRIDVRFTSIGGGADALQRAAKRLDQLVVDELRYGSLSRAPFADTTVGLPSGDGLTVTVMVLVGR
jgi:hypothetical protein